MNNDYFNWWSELLRWLITSLVFGFYIALTFFSFRGNWDFLTNFEYYTTTLSATTVAWFLRWIWAQKGLEIRLFKSEDIKDKQIGKDTLISDINSNNLTDLLEIEINQRNKATKLKEYKNKCEKNRNKLKGRKFRVKKYEYWKQQRIECDSPEFNVDVVRVRHYRYDIDSMLSSSYKQGNDIETRGNLNRDVLTSFRTNMVTLLVFALLGALQVFVKSYSTEDLFVLLGRMLVFVINVYSGLNLGISFVDNKYSNDLSKDYVVLKTVLKNNNIKGYS